MCGNKIQRDIFACAMFDECIHPRCLCGCRTSHAKPSIYFFDRVGSVIVKLPISILFRLTRPEIDVGLIPDFEIPFGNFSGAISLNQVPGKSRDKLVPFVPTFWRRDIRFIPKRVQSLLRGQLPRHEAQLNKWLHSVGQQAVVDLVYVGEVINWVPFRIFPIHSHFVVKDGMEADELEVSSLLYFPEVTPVTLAQAKEGASRTKHLFPKVREGLRRGSRVYRDDFCGGRGLAVG